MAKKKQPVSSVALQPLPAAPTRTDQAERNGTRPFSPRIKRMATCLLVLHFVAFTLSLAANFAPSSLQGKLMNLAAIYLVTTNQDYGALPLELTHGAPVDFPLWIELRRAPSQNWERLRLPGETRRVDGSPDFRFSRWTNLSRLLHLVATDQPDAELLSDVTVALLRARGMEGRVEAVRWISQPVLSFDQHTFVVAGQESLIVAELMPQIVFSGRVIQDANGEISLLPDQEPMRTSKATDDR